MNDTNKAQHYIGKLLKYLGPDNIVWGTDYIFSDIPQCRSRPSRPSRSPTMSSNVRLPADHRRHEAEDLGLNAAEIPVDPVAARCKVDPSTFSMIKRELDGEARGRRWTVKPPLGPRNMQEFLAPAREQRAKGVPG